MLERSHTLKIVRIRMNQVSDCATKLIDTVLDVISLAYDCSCENAPHFVILDLILSLFYCPPKELIQKQLSHFNILIVANLLQQTSRCCKVGRKGCKRHRCNLIILQDQYNETFQDLNVILGQW